MYYPVNVMRNVALNNAPTDLVYLADVDFVPTMGAHDTLKNYSVSLNRKFEVLIHADCYDT